MTASVILSLLCIGMVSPCLSRATGYIYQFPGMTLQRVHPEQASGPPKANAARSRNWCQYTVPKTVSCQVHNGTETLVQRVFQSCRWPGPCSNLISYRTLVRPTYRLMYRQVTALEWRCCPGFLGDDCSQECMNCTGFANMDDRLSVLESKILLLAEAGPPPPLIHERHHPERHHPERHHPERDNEVGGARPTHASAPAVGLPGPRGLPGHIGHPGVTGPPGPKGETGTSGKPGPVGPRGPQGQRGTPGQRGLPGPAGPPGPALPFPGRGDVFGLRELDQYDELLNDQRAVIGPPGPTGPAGPPGRAGSTGPPGRPGAPGRNGGEGVAGKPGSAGAKGDSGERGSPGTRGEPGPLGAPGPKGEPGESLPEGEQLREALKILAERVLILEHMMGVHSDIPTLFADDPLEPGSGRDLPADLTPTFKNRKPEASAPLRPLPSRERPPSAEQRGRRAGS